MPVNTRWKVAEVLDAAWAYAGRTGRRVSIEYALIRDINDQAWRADLLGRLLKGKLVHVNLIPLNPTPGSKWTASRPRDEREFVTAARGARRDRHGARHPRPRDRRRLRSARSGHGALSAIPAGKGGSGRPPFDRNRPPMVSPGGRRGEL